MKTAAPKLKVKAGLMSRRISATNYNPANHCGVILRQYSQAALTPPASRSLQKLYADPTMARSNGAIRLRKSSGWRWEPDFNTI
jgi:hypothetical protein